MCIPNVPIKVQCIYYRNERTVGLIWDHGCFFGLENVCMNHLSQCQHIFDQKSFSKSSQSSISSTKSISLIGTFYLKKYTHLKKMLYIIKLYIFKCWKGFWEGLKTSFPVPKHPIKIFGAELGPYQPQIFSDLMSSHSKCLRSALGCCQKQQNFRSERHVVSKFRTLPNVTIVPKGGATSSPSTPLLAAFNNTFEYAFWAYIRKFLPKMAYNANFPRPPRTGHH